MPLTETVVREQPRLLLTHPDFYAVYKPAGYLAHPVQSHSASRAPNLLDYFRAELGEPDLAPPHRLDRETSGITLLTRHAKSARHFAVMFRQGLVGKRYLALVRGAPTWDSQLVDAPLGSLGLGGRNRVLLRQAVVPNGKEARTRFEVLARRGEYALLAAYPQTGRMHQIRAHLAHLGLPLLGDKIYGPAPYTANYDAFLEFRQHGQTPQLTDRLGHWRQALHASRVVFAWAGEQQAIECPLPPDLQALWTSLPEGEGESKSTS